MKKTLIAPKASSKMFVLTVTDPLPITMLIGYLKQEGIPAGDGIDGYDEKYPYLLWNGECLTQNRTQSYVTGKQIDTVQEFIDQFIQEEIRLQVGDYDTIITVDTIKVGCQTKPYHTK